MDKETSVDSERRALLALHLAPGVGSFLIKQLVGYCGSAQAVLHAQRSTLLSIPRIGKTLANTLLSGELLDQAAAEMEQAHRQGIRILFFNEANFPQRLNAHDDCPAMIYVKGDVNLNAQKTVGIVGTRQATAYGKAMVEKLIEGLAAHQPLIVSGLAYGVDICAHRESLARGLPTVGVMGSGVDVVYPATHRETAEKMIASNGGLIAESPLGAGPEAYRFPQRNRIIAALSDALIVVETAAKGGSLITANIANSYNKDVFAVPGSVGLPRSEGCNNLIKTNLAHLISKVSDIEMMMKWNAAEQERSTQAEAWWDPAKMNADENLLLALLQDRKEGMSIDELIRRTSMTPGLLASTLLSLEIKGVAQTLPGQRYTIKTRR